MAQQATDADVPTLGTLAAGTMRAQPSRLLTTVGPYRVVRLLGSGGMGEVYLAEQEEPVRRQVAVKVLRTGLATDEIVARFRSEQQTLALMDHPNITSVYDAGATDTGLPYFVMEYVVGETIDEYAAAHRLTIAERIPLFIQVCRAVQHAHQKGIIHRDIKPSNVIVTDVDGEARCKVIDFGIAKAMTPAPESVRLTMTGMALGTPAYMSPEQFLSGGADVDTRADIYALGATLYELLAGVLPIDPEKYSGWMAMVAQHAGADAAAPSARFAALRPAQRTQIAAARRTDAATLKHTLSGDLDCVVLTALEREREHRYATANALIVDLERYGAHEPVSARNATVTYRMRKFVRRHRAGVAFGVTVLTLLAATTVGAVLQARRLARARAVAVARQGQAEELIGFMLGDLRDKLTAVGRVDLLDAVGTSALAYFAAVPESQLSNEELFRRAQALQQLGEVRMAQDKLPEAAALMRRSLAISGRLAAHDSLNGRWQLGYAHSHFWAGSVDWELGNVDAALSHFEPFVIISRRLIAHYPDSLAYREELVYALNNIGFAKQAKGDLTGAIASFRSGIALNEELARLRPGNKDWQVSLANLENAVAVAERQSGELSGARAAHDRELAIKESLLARDTTNSERQRDVGTAHAYRGELRLMMGDTRGALDDAIAAQRIYARAAALDTADGSLLWRLAKSNRQVAQVMLEEDDPAGAVRQLEVGRAIVLRLLARNPQNQRAAAESILEQTADARASLALGRTADALTLSRRAAAAAEAAVNAKPEEIERHRAAGDAYDVLGDALDRSGNAVGARDAWSHALATLSSAPGHDAQTEILAVEATVLLELGRGSDAQPIIAELERRGYRDANFVKRLHARSERTA